MKKLFVIATIVGFSFCVANAQTTPSTTTKTETSSTTKTSKSSKTTKMKATKKGGKKKNNKMDSTAPAK